MDKLNIQEKKVWDILENIMDPEIPVLSILDLGIVRKVEVEETSQMPPELNIKVFITPTYTGCPAMDFIESNIRQVLTENGFNNIEVIHVLSPAWTTDWMSDAGKQKLKAYGIAPPKLTQQVCLATTFSDEDDVECPQCHSHNTQLISRFGSTPCKALYKCNHCHEPFDYFKCH
ncbi:MAG: phenylacetate-CoA oxygenase subunit PaaJ [Bacteroidetes bacterium]|nr:phenylacetate-CoA oxygenase subunit PaaJ [Bacteroidota bacterium]